MQSSRMQPSRLESSTSHDLSVPDRGSLAARDAGELAVPRLPPSRQLDAAGMLTVDIDERMDPAAAAEVADPAQSDPVRQVVRLGLVAATAVAVWLLLPPDQSATPPIELPPALQADDIPLTPLQQEAERRAIELLHEVGPSEAIDDLVACVEPGPSSHRLWRYLLDTLALLGRHDELLARARDYADRYPDRLEAAHFLAVALRMQSVASCLERDGWFGERMRPDVRRSLDDAQAALGRGLKLLNAHERDWPAVGRRQWADALRLDRAGMLWQRWQCAAAAFADPLRDDLLAELDSVSRQDAADVLQLRSDVYERLLRTWPRRWASDVREVRIGSQTYTKPALQQRIDTIRQTLAAHRAAHP
jgi:hypothetical protein